MNLKRVWHPIEKWEEITHNMWGSVEDSNAATDLAIEFTGQHKLYGSFMQRVIEEWKYSCENALTDYSLNRRAWLGHAAVALALQIPEYITRKAWANLNYEQQLLANKEAWRSIRKWEDGYRSREGIHKDVEASLLL